MVPKVIDVKPMQSHILLLEYENGEKRYFDVKPYCNSSFFSEILDWNYFVRVRLRNGTVEWPHEQDIAPETLYLESTPGK
jgi:hypothetical protein